jgi:class 3 adenylate cyclase/tetratricopeptide (TPR) repeat protein
MLTCPSCGFENADNARFCSQCATALGAAPAAPREERKVITVVFADLVGSTARAERLDPEDVRAILAPYHDRLRHELERHGGTVEKFIGDAVVGVFGAPVAHEDDPERAVRAALAIQEAIAELNEGDAQLELEVRVGVHTGEALVSVGARPELGEAMVAGDVMNTGARIQAAAPPGGVLVGTATHRATERAVEYRDADPVRAKGKQEPLAVWLALRRRSGFGVDTGGAGRAALVGRDRELDVLADALGRARDGREPQLVTLVGVPGIGKSRLVYELSRIVDEHPDLITWRQGRSLPYGEGVAFWALGEMVKGQAGILETDSPSEAGEKLTLAVRDLIADEAEATWVERSLRPLVGLPGREGSGADSPHDEGPAAWRRFVEALVESRPAVLVFEDLHWADDGVLDFVDELVDWLRNVPLLVVGTARPELLERRPGWGGGKRNATTISLSPLTDADTARLVGALLERSLLPAETQTELLARAGGNPLYAEEFARMHALDPSGDAGVPDSLQAIVAARIDALPSQEKSLLQVASVLGKVFWPDALIVLSGTERPELDARLRALERKEFVRRERRSAMGGDQQYVFLHALIRDVGYGQLPRVQRAAKHQLAGEWIESLGRADDHADLVAHHYGTSLELARAAGVSMEGLEEQARLALRQAGDRATQLGAAAAASRHYAAALELWPGDDPDRARLLLQFGKATSLAADGGGNALTEARDLFLAASDIEGAAETEYLLSSEIWRRGDTRLANEHLQRAVALLEDLPASRVKAEAFSSLSTRHMMGEDFVEAIRVGERALEIADGVGADEARVSALLGLGGARAGLGEWEAGLAEMERAVALAREIHSFQQLRSVGMLRDSMFELGDLTRSAELLEEGLSLADRVGHAVGRRWLRGEWAVDLYHAGAWDESCALIDEVVEADAPWWFDPEALRVRVLIRLARGENAEAEEDARVALEQARAGADPQVLYPPIVVTALVSATVGDRARASVFVDELLGLWHANLKRHPRASWIVELARVLGILDRHAEFATALEQVPRSTEWVEAARDLAAGTPELAVDRFRKIASRPCEALARMQAGETLAAAGHRADADVHLRSAAAFWQSVGAKAYLRETEALLAAAS